MHRSTKGGSVRRFNFVGSKDEIALCCDIMSKGNGLTKVWGKVHSGADIQFEKYVILYGKQASKLLRKLRGIFERHMVVNLTAGLPALRRV